MDTAVISIGSCSSSSTTPPNKLLYMISIKRSCLFFLAFILLIVLILGLMSFVIFVILKPQNPLFSIQTASLESYKLDVLESAASNNNKGDLLILLSSLLSLTLNASNPNKFGLSYAPSRLHVLENGMVIGMIKVPRFHQPPNSKNISLGAQVIIKCLNVNQIIAPADHQNTTTNNDVFQILRILGDIGVQVRVFRITLPKLRIALDCGITMDKKHLTFNSKTRRIMKAAAMVNINVARFKYVSLPTASASASASQLFSKKCSFAIYV